MKATTGFYRWEGDACRLHTDTLGDMTADIYRVGRGAVPIHPGELLRSGVPIRAWDYWALVVEEILSKFRP